MKCLKCGADLPENAKFCLECGQKNQNVENDKTLPSNSLNNKKKAYIIGGISVLVLFIIFVAINFSNSVGKFERLLLNGQYQEAKNVYSQNIKGDEVKENNIKLLLENQAALVLDKYKSKEFTYDVAKNKLKGLQDLGIINNEIRKVETKIEALQNSRISFEKAKEHLNNGNYGKAIEEFNNVIEEDENYSVAQKQIEDNLIVFKNEVIRVADDYYNNDDVDSALKTIEDGLKYLKKDEVLNAKREVYKEKKIELLRDNQEVAVISTRIISDWLRDEMAEVVVKNTTNKVVKNYEVGYMAYDKNGYPVKVGWLSPDYLKVGFGEANIQPNQTFGRNKGWELRNENAHSILAIVKKVEYYDGSEWHNPYYEYWVDEHLEKPLN